MIDEAVVHPGEAEVIIGILSRVVITPCSMLQINNCFLILLLKTEIKLSQLLVLILIYLGKLKDL